MHPALRPYVASVTAYDVTGAPGVHRGLPSTSLTFVLPVDQPLDVGWAGVAASRAARWSTVSGLHSHPAAIHHDGTQRGVQLALTTDGAPALLGVPAAGLARELLSLEEVCADMRHLPEQLAGAASGGAGTMIGVVEAALLAALARRGAPRQRAAVARALARLTRGVAVQEVALDVGYSRRRLSTLVRQECGLTPKEYQRVARFEVSRGLVGHRPLADVAARCGYVDQAHLTREWNALAGCAPTTWLREEFPFVQDQDGPAPSG